MTAIRVLVVDDHSVVREGVRHVLSDARAFNVVGEASSAAAALTVAARTEPDVIVLDVSMPGGSGLQAVAGLLERAPKARILMFSVHDDPEYVRQSARAGAHGYVRKNSAPAELRTAIAAVYAGEKVFPLRAVQPPTALAPRGTELLTPREREVLVCVAQGKTNRETAAALGISHRTVEAHRDTIGRKLGVRTAAGLTRLALAQGMLDDTLS